MCNSNQSMKQNKNRIINIRITESEFEAVHRLSKHFKRSIADLLRSYINREDLKLLQNEQSQQTIFEKSEVEKMIEMNRVLLAQYSLLTLSNPLTESVEMVNNKPVRTIKGVKGRHGTKVKVRFGKKVVKRKKGIELNE